MEVNASSAEVLDLCVRKRNHSPEVHVSPTIYDSSIGQYSPVSNSDSESSEVSSNSEMKMFNLKSKGCRPFKAYIKDPFNLAQGLVNPETLFGKDSSEAFVQFRSKVLSQVNTTNSGTNKNMRRTNNLMQNKNAEDPTYWEKRRKNNEAAKRSRDARRAKEDEIAIRCAFLEQENCHLKFVTESLKRELERLQQVVYMKDFRK